MSKQRHSELTTLSKRTPLASAVLLTWNALDNDRFHDFIQTAKSQPYVFSFGIANSSQDNSDLVHTLDKIDLNSAPYYLVVGTGIYWANVNGVSVARQCFERAVILSPNDPYAWTRLSSCLIDEADVFRQGRVWRDIPQNEVKTVEDYYAKSVDAAQRAVALSPNNEITLTALSKAAAFYGDEDISKGSLKKALTLNPDYYEAICWNIQLTQSKWFGSDDELIAYVKSLRKRKAVYTAHLIEIYNALYVVATSSNKAKVMLKQNEADIKAYVASPDNNIDLIMSILDSSITPSTPSE